MPDCFSHVAWIALMTVFPSHPSLSSLSISGCPIQYQPINGEEFLRVLSNVDCTATATITAAAAASTTIGAAATTTTTAVLFAAAAIACIDYSTQVKSARTSSVRLGTCVFFFFFFLGWMLPEK